MPERRDHSEPSNEAKLFLDFVSALRKPFATRCLFCYLVVSFVSYRNIECQLLDEQPPQSGRRRRWRWWRRRWSDAATRRSATARAQQHNGTQSGIYHFCCCSFTHDVENLVIFNKLFILSRISDFTRSDSVPFACHRKWTLTYVILRAARSMYSLRSCLHLSCNYNYHCFYMHNQIQNQVNNQDPSRGSQQQQKLNTK